MSPFHAPTTRQKKYERSSNFRLSSMLAGWQMDPAIDAGLPVTRPQTAPIAGAPVASARAVNTPASVAATQNGQIQELNADHAAAYVDHLLRLSREDRRLRFGQPTTDRRVRRSVDAIAWETTALFGWVEEGVMRGIVHLAWPDIAWLQGGAELAVSVESERQRRGIGLNLVAEAVAEARRRRLPCIHYVGLAENRGMAALMKKLGGTAIRKGGEIAGRIDLPVDSHLPGLNRRSRLRHRRRGGSLEAAVAGVDLTPRLA